MAASPTQLTLKRLRSEGYLAAVTEHWNPFAHIRQDLFGFVDVLGVGPKGTIAVQATSDSNLSKRVRKIADHDNLAMVREAGWTIQCWGWKKNKSGRWQCRVVDIS